MPSSRWNDSIAKKYIGDFKSCYFGYSLLEEVRQNAASGGIVSTILIHALQDKQINGALLCRSIIRDNEVAVEHFIARDYEDILQSQGSKYISTRFAAEAIPLINNHKGNLAVVCLPCEARILHYLRQKDSRIDKKIKLVITLFCGHASKEELTRLVLHKLNPYNKQIKGLRYRSGHWRGNLKLEFSDGSLITKPFSYFGDYQNLFFFTESKCLQCGDHTGIYSDVSIGDVWSRKMKANPIKHNSILVRSDAGVHIINQISQNGMAHIFPVSAADICGGQSRSLLLHAGVNARAEAGHTLGIHVKKTSDHQPSFLEKLAAKIILYNYQLSRKENGYKIIQHLPRFLIKIYLYFFKALQVLLKPEGNMQSIAIMGGSIWGNRGAESMLVTTLAKLREKYPEADYKVFSIYPEKDRSLINDPKVTILSSRPASLLKYFPFALLYWLFSRIGIKIWLPSAVRQLRDCSMMFDIGGITFAERGLILIYNIFTLWPAMLLGVPVSKLSQAVGPFNSPANRFFARIFLNRCQAIYPRGEISAGYLRNLGIKNNQPAAISADIAFLYKPDFSLSHENEDKVKNLSEKLSKYKKDGKTIIFIAPSSVVLKKINSPQYEHTILDAILKADQPDFQYIFLPNSNRSSSKKSQNNDIFVLNKIKLIAKNECPPDILQRMYWIDWDLNTLGIRELMQYANLVITSRFHAMVSSLALGIPVFVIGWSHKYQEVLRMFDLEENMVDFKDANSDVLTAMISKNLKDREITRKKIYNSLHSVINSAEYQFETNYIQFSKE